MNDMSRQTSAARLSEDIGDVLSAIRRLIAEDDALTAERDGRHDERNQPVTVQLDLMGAVPRQMAAGGDFLAGRHGGNAALAREMVQSRVATSRHLPIGEVEDFSDADDDAVYGPDSPANDIPADDEGGGQASTHPFEATFFSGGPQAAGASQQGSEGIDFLTMVDDDSADRVVEDLPRPLLRLREADRVIASQSASGHETPAQLNSVIEWRSWVQPDRGPTATLDIDALSVEEERDFAAAFDSIAARDMRQIVSPAEAAEAAEEAALPAGLTGLADATASGDAATPEVIKADLSGTVAPEVAADETPNLVKTAVADEAVEDDVTSDIIPDLAADAREIAGAAVPDDQVGTAANDAAVPPAFETAASLQITRQRVSRWARIEPPVTRRQAVASRFDGTQARVNSAHPFHVSKRDTGMVETSATPVVMDEHAKAGVAAIAQETPSVNMASEAVRSQEPVATPITIDALATIATPEASQDVPLPSAEPVALETVMDPTMIDPEAGPLEVKPVPDLTAVAPTSGPDMGTDLEIEASVRDVIRELVQEELHGELGQRFSRNLRAVVRREVAAAIEDQLDRF